jgi:uncharacterized protein YqgV (UPF0045/DUF77 family)
VVIAAQVALYPLRQERLTPAIEALGQALGEAGLAFTVGSMSTLVTGEADRVFDGLRAGFLRAAASGHVVMTVTVSNACPV